MTTSLLYFVKYPTPGKVKTRLAKQIGAQEAAKIYDSMARGLLNILTPLTRDGVSLVITYDPFASESQVRSWLPGPYQYLAQKGEDLGERLQVSFESQFQQGLEKVIAIGSDILDLKTDIVREAISLLDHHDVVLGPAKDGGYYLIGMRKSAPELFQGIPWSTEEVLNATVERIKRQGLSYKMLKELEDLDEVKV